jgi:hypothetical protein
MPERKGTWCSTAEGGGTSASLREDAEIGKK